jgi:hypothetical protein
MVVYCVEAVCCVAVATQHTDVLVSTYTSIFDVQLIKLLLMMDEHSTKHVEHLIENKV